MTDKDEESEQDSETQEKPSTILAPGNLLSFGSINITFSLSLKQKDMKKYKIKFDNLKALEDIKFITKHKRFAKRVELSSKDNVLNILLNINKSAKKLLKIGYISYRKIIYKEDQEIFKDFIDNVTNMNGLYLASSDICKCPMCIELILIYENKKKKFVICGDDLGEAIKEEKEENSGESDKDVTNDDKNNNKKNLGSVVKKAKENKSEDKNPFVGITNNIVNLGEYNYIYFNYDDYTNGEFSNKINIINVYEYFQNIKLTSKSKIILNLENTDLNNDKHNLLRDLLALTDIFIFYDKNKLYEVLKSMKEQEDDENTEKLYKFHSLQNEKKIIEKEELQHLEIEKTKKYKLFLEKEKVKEKRFKKILNIDKRSNTEQNESCYNKSKIYITQEDNDFKNKESEISEINKMINTATDDGLSPTNKKNKNIYKSNKKFIMKLCQPQTLNKNHMWEYFKHGIYNKDPQKRGEKIIITMDDFKKIYFVRLTKKAENPIILEYDLKLHPQINLQNMKEILEFKQLIKSKFDEYIKIYIGTLLGTILKKNNIEDNDLLLGYLYATNKIKKLAEIQKYNLPMPKDKNFFYPNISKKGLEQMLTRSIFNKKEKSFILDGNKKKTIGIKQYNPLLDKNLASFFNTRNNQNFLKLKGFINNAGEIMYDPIYRDTLRDKKTIVIDENAMYKSFQTTNKFLFGYKKKIPEYSIYHPNKSNIVLPPLPKNKKQNTIETEKKKDTIDEADDESGGNSGSRSRSGSGSGDSGSGGADSGSDNNDKESNKESEN